MSEKKSVAPIMSIWGKSEKDVQKDNIDLSLQMLQSDGEKAIITAKRAVIAAQQAYDKALLDSSKDQNFSVIAAARLKKRAADLEYQNTLDTYEELFGVKPQIAV